MKRATGAGEPLVGRRRLYQALGATFTEVKVRREPECRPLKDPAEIADEGWALPGDEAFCAAAG